MRHTDNSDPVGALRDAVAASLAEHVPGGEPLAVALSGGRDSVALLDALLHVAPARGHAVAAAFHIHHGLSKHADAWQQFCTTLCAQRAVTLSIAAVSVPRSPRASLESEARRMRYAALANMAKAAGLRYVALAHHRDDQAETLLLQLLRGAGPHGLSSMSALRTDPRGVFWLRPLLGVPRTAIDAYVQAQSLTWVDDESNADPRHLRNAIRHGVMPALTAVAASAATTLARAAALQSDAARLADDLAAQDAQHAVDGATVDRAALAALPPHRARNLLRWFLRQNELAAPSSARLSAMVSQLASARSDAQVRLAHAGIELGVYRGRIRIHARPPCAFDVPWRGEAELLLPHGVLLFAHAEGTGIDEARLSAAPVRVRSRVGGERLQLAPNRPRRALKSILQDAGIPAWERPFLPLVCCGDALAAAVGVGIDAQFRAPPGQRGITLVWRPKVPGADR
jgi:tRNA(Ile)-lysidine synthase